MLIQADFDSYHGRYSRGNGSFVALAFVQIKLGKLPTILQNERFRLIRPIDVDARGRLVGDAQFVVILRARYLDLRRQMQLPAFSEGFLVEVRDVCYQSSAFIKRLYAGESNSIDSIKPETTQ